MSKPETRIFLNQPLPDSAKCVVCGDERYIDLFLTKQNDPVAVLWNVCLDCRRTYARENRANRLKQELGIK